MDSKEYRKVFQSKSKADLVDRLVEDHKMQETMWAIFHDAQEAIEAIEYLASRGDISPITIAALMKMLKHYMTDRNF